jgi:hypothetical protein
MATRNEDLRRVAATLDAHLGSPAVIHHGQIHVDTGWREALVIEPVINEAGKVWVVTACAWDASNGLTDELEVGVESEATLAEFCRTWLNEQREQDALLEALLEGRP